MALVTVHKLHGEVEMKQFHPQKGSSILGWLERRYGLGDLMAGEVCITAEEDVAAGDYTYHVTGAAQQLAAPAVDSRQRFINLLQQGNINSPKPEVLDLVESRCAARMQVCSRVTMAVNLYRDVQQFPGASTQRHLLTQHGLYVNGPLFSNPAEGPACLLVAARANGQPAIVKMLPGAMPPGSQLLGDWQQQLPPQHMEAIAVRDLLGDRPDGLPLAEMELISVNLTEHHSSFGRMPGLYHALVMPVYATTLAKLLHAAPEVVLAQGRRMQHALQHIHDRGYVHMDVKADNIFVDTAGLWWLADLGSAVKENQCILSTTHCFAPVKDLIGKPAKRHYDWHMLAVALVCELHKATWKELLVENGHTPMSRLASVVQQLEESDIKVFLTGILQLAQPAESSACDSAWSAGCW